MAQKVKNPPANQEMWVWSLSWEDPQKGMPTHSSILARNIPWTEEPGRLQSMGSRRVGYHWATKHKLVTSPRCERQTDLLPQIEEVKTIYQIPIRKWMRWSCESMSPRALEREKWQGEDIAMNVLFKHRFHMKQESDERPTEFQGLWY